MKRLAIAFCVLLAGCANPTPKYKVGEIVQTKIGKLRGHVLKARCDVLGEKYCLYIVRFPVGSMNEQHMREYEIERAPVPATANR